ncbi:hypothetical protein JKP88DRAFT_335969 [Tribonema minus]|uniref:V-SNARE coiled-coil homology domain-containing protein n=1 Tax=Tribonema minus TaxID=303371 RepID=A0A835YJ59_9STRA|nr:hypothetical protein JKP88DRAFT_335969 [Tribonema minus]
MHPLKLGRDLKSARAIVDKHIAEPIKQAIAPSHRKRGRVGSDEATPAKLLACFSAPPLLFGHRGIPDGTIALALEPQTGLLALAASDGTVKVIGGPGIEVLLEPTRSEGEATRAAPTMLGFVDPNTLAGADADGRLWVWDVTGAGAQTGHLTPLVWSTGVTITAFAVAGATASGYVLLGTSAGAVHAVECAQCNLSAHSITAQDAGFPQSLLDQGVPGAVTAIACNPCEPACVLIGYAYGGAVVWDWARRAKRVLCEPSGASSSGSGGGGGGGGSGGGGTALTCLAWHPKGKAFAVGFANGRYAIFDERTPDAPLRVLRAAAAAPAAGPIARRPVTHLQWLRTRHGAAKTWVLAAAGGSDAAARDGVAFLVARGRGGAFGAATELACAAVAELCGDGERCLTAAVWMSADDGGGGVEFTAVALVGGGSSGGGGADALSAAAGDGGGGDAPVLSAAGGHRTLEEGDEAQHAAEVAAAVTSGKRRGAVRTASLVSRAPGTVEVVDATSTSTTTLPRWPSPLAFAAPISAVAISPPLPTSMIVRLAAAGPMQCGGSSGGGAGAHPQRGGLDTLPSADAGAETVSELVAVGHADGTLTLWHAFAPLPLRARPAAAYAEPLLHTHALGSAHMELIAALPACTLRGGSAAAGAAVADAAAAAAAPVTALGFADAGAAGGLLLGVGFGDGVAALLRIGGSGGSSGADSGALPPPTARIRLPHKALSPKAHSPKPRSPKLLSPKRLSPKASSPKNATPKAASLAALAAEAPSPKALSQPPPQASDDIAAAATGALHDPPPPAPPDAATAAAYCAVLAVVTGGASSVARVSPWWAAATGPLLAVAYSDGTAAAARAHGAAVHMLSAADRPCATQLAWARSSGGGSSSGGGGAVLCALQPWRVRAYDAATWSLLSDAAVDFDLDAAAAAADDAPCALLCVGADGAPERCCAAATDCGDGDGGSGGAAGGDSDGSDGGGDDDDDDGGDMPGNMPALQQQQGAAAALPEHCRLVACSSTRVALIRLVREPGKPARAEVEALNSVASASSAAAAAAPAAAASAAAAGIIAVRCGSAPPLHCVACAGADSTVSVFLLPSLTHILSSTVPPHCCLSISAWGETVGASAGTRALRRCALVAPQRHAARGGGGALPRLATAAALRPVEPADLSAAAGWRDRLLGRRRSDQVARVRQLLDEATTPPPPPLSPPLSPALAPRPAAAAAAAAAAARDASGAARKGSAAAQHGAKAELFSGRSRGAAAAEGGGGARRRESAAAAEGGAAGVQSRIAEAAALARERGERLNCMQEKTEALQSDAADFASMAAQLNREMDKQAECSVS